MRLDPQVGSLRVLAPQTVLAMVIADGVFKEEAGRELVVTSLYRPSDPRLHGRGLAFDARCKDLGPPHYHVVTRLRVRLAPFGYDVVHHDGFEPGIAEHIHVEYDPK